MERFYYAHLVSSQDPDFKVLETVKMQGKDLLDASNVSEEVFNYLKNQRNDGNKVYSIVSMHLGDPSLEVVGKD